ncbi:MAG: hypothetical protein K6C68_07420 [Ruminococcus sp.]|nr:hypothetical protein [Ruminococcus sp.]
MSRMSPALQHRHIVQIRYENVKKATCCDAGSYDLVSYCSICGRELSCRTITTPMKAHVYGKPMVDDDADSYLWIDPDKHLVIKCEICGGYLYPGDDTKTADLCFDSIGKIPYFDTRGIIPGKWSENFQDDEDTYDQSSEIEKTLMESNLYEGMEFDKIARLPIYHQMKKIGYIYSKRSRCFVFVGVAREKGE